MSRSFGGRSLTTRPPMTISPLGDLLQPGDHAQQRRFAAAGRADQDEELAVGDFEVDGVQDLRGTEGLVDGTNLDRCHGNPSTLKNTIPSRWPNPALRRDISNQAGNSALTMVNLHSYRASAIPGVARGSCHVADTPISRTRDGCRRRRPPPAKAFHQANICCGRNVLSRGKKMKITRPTIETTKKGMDPRKMSSSVTSDSATALAA